MESPKLEDFQPETGSFTLSINKTTYTLRKFCVADEIWLKKKYGDDTDIQLIISNSRKDFSKIAEIAFNQINDEQKKDFLKKKVMFVDDEGNYKEMEIGGSTLLFHMIAGELEKRDVLYAVIQTFGVSRPQIDRAEKEVKKKIKEQTGQESSISSQASTVGL